MILKVIEIDYVEILKILKVIEIDYVEEHIGCNLEHQVEYKAKKQTI